jgi:hypothetical protein
MTARAVQEIGRADDGQLAGIQDPATRLLDEFEQHMRRDLVKYLCRWRGREAASGKKQHQEKPAQTGAPQSLLRGPAS